MCPQRNAATAVKTRPLANANSTARVPNAPASSPASANSESSRGAFARCDSIGTGEQAVDGGDGDHEPKGRARCGEGRPPVGLFAQHSSCEDGQC